MTTSLMDILSCGLAAVIILMIIALSSSKLQQEERLSASFYEIQIQHECEISKMLVIRNSKSGAEDSTEMKNVTTSERVYKYIVELPASYDSTLDIKIYRPRPFIDVSKGDTLFCQDILVSVKPEAGLFSLEFKLDNTNRFNRQDSAYVVEYRCINNFNNIPEKYERKGYLRGAKKLVVEYSSSPRIYIK